MVLLCTAAANPAVILSFLDSRVLEPDHIHTGGRSDDSNGSHPGHTRSLIPLGTSFTRVESCMNRPDMTIDADKVNGSI